MMNLANALKLLADDTRLRVLRLVAREPLNVSELTAILGLAQSGVSRHLSLLRKAGLVEERREGGWSYYLVAQGLTDAAAGGSVDTELARAWAFVRSELEAEEDPYHDLVRLDEVLRQREDFGGGLNERLLEPGLSWFAWSRALHFLLPRLDVIDLGCGDGTLTVEIGRFAGRVLGVDLDDEMLEAARRRAQRLGLTNVEYRQADIAALPVGDGQYDLAIASQSLHHMADPGQGLSEAVRVLRPGGRLIVVDLAPHRQHWVKSKLGHAHLGFAPEALTGLMTGQGLTEVTHQPVNQRRGESFRVILVTGVKPGAPVRGGDPLAALNSSAGSS